MALSKTEKLSHYAVVVIAISAVVVSVWQSRISEKHLEISREHNRLTVKPWLSVFTGWTEGPEQYNITLSNEGIGPAIIKSVEYKFGDHAYNGWDDVLDAAEIRNLRRGSYQLGNDAPFATEREETLLRLHMPETEFRHIGIELVIHYESIYEEKMKPIVIRF